MNRRLLAAAFALVAASAAGAHHIWIVPENAAKPNARVIFSDTLMPDEAALLQKIGHAKLWLRDHTGKDAPLQWDIDDDSYALEVPGKGSRTIGASCIYGVHGWDHRTQKTVDPYLLTYYAKTILGEDSAPKPWDKLALEIIPKISGNEVRLQVVFQGKPVPKAEMRVQVPGDKRMDLQTDAQGVVVFPVKKTGKYGFQTRHVEQKPGEYNGKKYVEIRHHSTLVLDLAASGAEKK